MNEVRGQPFVKFVHPDDIPECIKRFRRRLSGNYDTDEFRILTKDGRVRYVSISSRPLEKEGTIIGYNNIMTDITDRKQTQEALALANRKLSLLNSITRHDILNQLTILQGYLHLSTESGNNPNKLQEFIAKEQRVANTIEHQIRFTRDYQDMGMNFPSWMNVSESINQATARLQMRSVEVDIERTDVEIFVDPLFEKVFYNLIDNSLNYGGEQFCAIHIFYQESDNWLVIVYEDNGEGISIEDKNRLFERGFGKHTGLGLFLCREILSITGITITETSDVGKGARFEITVPKGAYRIGESRK